MTRQTLKFAVCLLLAGPVAAADGDATDTPAAASAATDAAAPAPSGNAPANDEASAPPVTMTTADIDLETTAIKGSQELPRVLVIVPWKKARPGQLEGRPANSLLDEALAPIDREVFARQIGFYTQITTDNTEE